MNRVLIVVDYQNDFVNGSLGFPGAEALADPIVERIKEYRKNGDDIIFTVDTHDEDYLDTQEGRKLPVEHCIRETEGWYIYEKVADASKDKDEFFCKATFPSLELGNWLEECDYAQVELCGLVSQHVLRRDLVGHFLSAVSVMVLWELYQVISRIVTDVAAPGLLLRIALGEWFWTLVFSFPVYWACRFCCLHYGRIYHE